MDLAQFTLAANGRSLLIAPGEVKHIVERPDETIIYAETLGVPNLYFVREDIHVVQLRLNRITEGHIRRRERERVTQFSLN